MEMHGGDPPVMGEEKCEPLLNIRWYVGKTMKYPLAEELFAPQEPNITIRCKGGNETQVRQKTLFNLMGCFSREKKDQQSYNRTSHILDFVDVDILDLVVEFVEKGEVKLRQNEYVRFGEAVETLQPLPTYHYKAIGKPDRVAITAFGHAHRFKNFTFGTGDVKIKITSEETHIFMHSIAVSLYSVVLNDKIENPNLLQKSSWLTRILVDDTTYEELANIRKLIYGRVVIKCTHELSAFLKLLERFQISYTNLMSNNHVPRLSWEQIKDIYYGEAISTFMLSVRQKKKRWEKIQEKMEQERKKQEEEEQSSEQAIALPPPTKKTRLENTIGEHLGEDQQMSFGRAKRTHERAEKSTRSASFPEQQASTSSTSRILEVVPSDLELFSTAPGPSRRSGESLPETTPTEESRIGESESEIPIWIVDPDMDTASDLSMTDSSFEEEPLTEIFLP